MAYISYILSFGLGMYIERPSWLFNIQVTIFWTNSINISNEIAFILQLYKVTHVVYIVLMLKLSIPL